MNPAPPPADQQPGNPVMAQPVVMQPAVVQPVVVQPVVANQEKPGLYVPESWGRYLFFFLIIILLLIAQAAGIDVGHLLSGLLV